MLMSRCPNDPCAQSLVIFKLFYRRSFYLGRYPGFCGCAACSGLPLRLSLLIWIETKRAIIVATYMIPITASIRLSERASGDDGVTSP